jgi:hypothetical protein
MLSLVGGTLLAWTEQIGRFSYTKIGAIVAKPDGRTLRRIGLNSAADRNKNKIANRRSGGAASRRGPKNLKTKSMGPLLS